MSTVLLQTTYFGPVQWYQKLARYDYCLVEQYDSYQKQTYRNRCVIATANGLQTLTVPVEHHSQLFKVADKNTEFGNALSSQFVKDLKTCASVTITNGVVFIGMHYKVPIVRAPSLSIMRMTSVPSLNKSMSFLLT